MRRFGGKELVGVWLGDSDEEAKECNHSELNERECDGDGGGLEDLFPFKSVSNSFNPDTPELEVSAPEVYQSRQSTMTRNFKESSKP